MLNDAPSDVGIIATCWPIKADKIPRVIAQGVKQHISASGGLGGAEGCAAVPSLDCARYA